jgi:hypothetical protein
MHFFSSLYLKDIYCVINQNCGVKIFSLLACCMKRNTMNIWSCKEKIWEKEFKDFVASLFFWELWKISSLFSERFCELSYNHMEQKETFNSFVIRANIVKWQKDEWNEKKLFCVIFPFLLFSSLFIMILHYCLWKW